MPRAATRREFLKTSSAVLASACFVRAGYGEEGPLVGHGSHRYRVVKDWGVLDPNEVPVNDCHGMVQDSKGRLLMLTNHVKNNVLIYDKAGKLMGTWGHTYPGAHGLSIVKEGSDEFLWITDHNTHEVYKTTLGGEVVMKLGWPEESGKYKDAGQYKPTNTATAPNGDLYVFDGYGLSFLIQYDKSGKFIRTFGGGGNAPENLATAHGGVVDTRDPARTLLVVCSRGHKVLKRYTLEGVYVDTIPLLDGQVCHAVQHGQELYVPQLNGFVSILDANNKVVSNPGGNAPEYDENGQLRKIHQAGQTFIHPHGILVDDESSVYVPQWNSKKTYPIKLQRVRA